MLNEINLEYNNGIINKQGKIKYIVAIIALIILGLISNVNKAYAEEYTVGDVTFAYNIVDGKAENVYVSAYKGEKPSKSTFKGITLEIPSNLNGYDVVSIGDGVNTILGMHTLDAQKSGHTDYQQIYDTIILPNTLKTINNYAMYASTLDRKIEIPNSVTKIGDFAFANVHYYYNIETEIVIPDSVETIGDYAFSNFFGRALYKDYKLERNCDKYWFGRGPKGFTSLKLGSGIKSIGKYAFANQWHITTLTIPENVTDIGEGAFTLTSIKQLNIQERATTLNIGDWCFAGSLINHNMVIKDKYNMGAYVFARCNYLPSVEFESTITAIPKGICFDCEKISDVRKTRITAIGKDAFRLCPSITTAEYTDITKEATIIGEYAFRSCTGITETIEIPSCVTAMGNGVFRECTNIVNVTMSTPITNLPAETFMDCKSLITDAYYNIIEKITSIGDYAFSGCTSLTGEIIVDNRVTYLGKYAFSRCSKIEQATINAPIKELLDGVYQDCELLSKVTKNNSITAIRNETFENCISIPSEVLHNNILTNITLIGSKAFKNCKGIEGTLTINGIVTNIGDEAFNDCTNVSKIVFQEGTIKTIGKKAFHNDAPSQEVIRICGDRDYKWSKIGSHAFTDIKELFINKKREDISLDYKYYGNSLTTPIVHYYDCTHFVDVICTLPGVKLVNPETNEELVSKPVACESRYSFKLVIDDEYKDKYKDLVIKLVSEGQYSDSKQVEEFITLDSNNTYTIDSVTRNKKIIVQKTQNGTDLVLREFISQVNGTDLKEKRTPQVENAEDKVDTFDYNHTKYPLVLKLGDKITYTIRVYNEGNLDGEANKIAVRLSEGLTYTDVGSTQGWTVSEDGRTITSEYLKDKKIEKYSGTGRPQYEELIFVCEITEQGEQDNYMVALAEIVDGNDLDSLENSTVDTDLTVFMREEAYLSSSDIYTKCIEDDTDFEGVELKGKVRVGYNLVINKIDSLSNELLNGAKIRLLDENKNEIRTILTQDGKADFGDITTYGEGTDIYYIEEIETPAGYKRTIDGMVELQVIKTVDEEGATSVEIVCDLQDKKEEAEDFKADVDETKEFIPITSAEELSKIGSSEEITVNGKTYTFAENANYRLENDIVAGKFTPINYMNGIFDGNNKTISELSIEGRASECPEVGVFRVFSGEIRNLTIDGMQIFGAMNASTSAKQPMCWYTDDACSSTGALVGYMLSGTIKNCTLKNGKIESNLNNVGGFVGHTGKDNTIKFDECTIENTVTVALNCKNNSVPNNNLGGFVGCVLGDAILKNSTSNAIIGNVKSNINNVGGFVGYISLSRRITADKLTNNASTVMGVSNVGGIVGYIGEGTTANIYDCENNATIQSIKTSYIGYWGDTIVRGNNTGGIIGFSEGVANIVNCSNTASISSYGNNVGGIIGHAEPKGDFKQNVTVNYDEENKTIELYMKNKQTQGNYSLQIQKADLALNKTLSGAHFNIYNSKLELIKEDEEVDENGILRIDDIKIDSIVPDVYYIKETKAPEGYEILVKDYIKIQVNIKWDGVNEKYLIDTKPTIEVDENIEEIEQENDNTNTGKQIGTITCENVRYKSRKTSIIDCSNSGNITSEQQYDSNTYDGNYGGIAGVIEGSNLIENCSNTAETISSNREVGGIVGQLMLYDYEDSSIVSKCTNSGKVIGNSVGGIIGHNTMPVKVYDCVNTESGIISEGSNKLNSNLGGIIGGTRANTYVENCENYADLTKGYVVGGIIGCNMGSYRTYTLSERYVENDYTQIVNCIVKDCGVGTVVVTENGAYTGSANNSGGIVGVSHNPKIRIDDCYVENVNLSSKDAGGIIGTYSNEEIIINNSNVINSRIVAGEQGAGIIAGVSGWMFYNQEMFMIDQLNIKLDGCNVLGCAINSKKDASGIIGHTGYSNRRNMYLDVTHCNVGVDEGGHDSVINGEGHSAGIYSGLYGGDISVVNIEECSVDNTTIDAGDSKYNPMNGYSGCSGIMGNTLVYGDSVDINIAKCNVTNCKLIGGTEANSGTSSSGGYASGILGVMYASNYGDSHSILNISECNVVGTDIKSSTEDIGGISGYLYQVRDATFSNCKVEDLNITKLREERIVPADNIGGFIGGSYGADKGLKFNNCEVSGVNIDAPAENLSTFMGSGIYSNTSMSGIKVTPYIDSNTKVERKNNLVVYEQTSTCGGLGGMSYNCNGATFEDIECSDIIIVPNEKETMCANNYNFGGLYGFQGEASSATFNNIKVKNIDYDVKRYPGYGREYDGSCAGFIGTTISNSTTDLSNIEIEDININTNTGKVAGFIGCIVYSSGSSINIDNININNFTVDMDNSIGARNNVSGFIDVNLAGTSNISNVDINNIDLNMYNSLEVSHNYEGSSTMSGLIGYNYTSGGQEIKDIRLNNINMVATVAETKEKALKVVNMAGIIAYDVSDEKVSIDSVEINDISMNTNSERGSIGGIYGVQKGLDDYTRNVSISNSQVNNITATGQYAVGGILGIGNVDISNCKVTNPVLTGQEGVATEGWGEKISGVTMPIIGGAVGIAVEGSNLDNITVTADLPEGQTEPSTYGVFSDYIAAGLVGINSGEISNSKVENIVVKSTKETINLEETNPDETTEENTEPVVVVGNVVGAHANEIQVLSLQNFIECIATNVKVICGDK